MDDQVGSKGNGKVEAAGGAAAAVWGEIRSNSYEGSSEEALEEFKVQSDGSFETTRLEEAEGSDDVWGADTVTAVAPAEMAGAANFLGGVGSGGPRPQQEPMPLVQLWCQRLGRPGLMWVALISMRYVS